MSSTSIPPLGGPSPAEDAFKVYTLKSDVRFLSKAVQPPSYVYVDPNDVLQVAVASNVGTEVVTVSYRLLRADGELILGQFQVSAFIPRVIFTHQEPLAEGFLLSVSCKAASAFSRGQTFVRVFLTDQSLGAGQPSYMLMADYVTTAMAPAHPNGRVLAPSEGPGWRHDTQTTPPGPGANVAFIAPVGSRMKFISAQLSIVTSAAPGNRIFLINYTAGGGFTMQTCVEQVIAPSQSIVIGVSTVRNIPAAGSNLLWAPCPADYVMIAGDLVETGCTGLQPTDQISGWSIAIEEWLDNV